MNLLILGAGGHGQVVREVAKATGRYEKIAFLDDMWSKDEKNDLPDVIGTFSDYDKFKGQFSHAFVAIGNSATRKEYQMILVRKYEIPILIHPSSYVSSNQSIKRGTVVMAGAVIQPNSKIGEGCIISPGAIVDHDSEVGDYCHINAGAIVPSMSMVPAGTKVDYGAVYHRTPNEKWIEKYKEQFGTEPGFF